MDQQNLVSTLKAQHRALQVDLGLALDSTQKETTDSGENILSSLEKFKQDLLGHVSLENNKFYPMLLEKMKEHGDATDNTKKFISAMDNIATAVIGFLTKYNEVKTIMADRQVFVQNLENIIKTLNVRIESEEEGVFETFLILI
jgi:regulator of sigma D